MKNTIYKILALSILLISGCSDEFLEKKPDKSLVVPTTLEDMQALLDNADRVMNIVPAIGMIASDDAFTTSNGWKSLLTATERNSYIWALDTYNGEACSDWNIPYQQVFYANVVLDGLNNIVETSANETQWKNIKGSALFFRAHALHQLAEHFTMPYDQSNAETELGVPVRLTADINAEVKRSLLTETYRQIMDDLKVALPLLPATSMYKTRPTATAAKALLARIHLSMNQYEEAESYASQSLNDNSFLIDYNNLKPADARPVPRMNDEILFHAQMITYSYVVFATTYVDTLLYASYAQDDLRKDIFFRQRSTNRYTFKANYTGSTPLFGGIANDEVYLIRAECRARLNNVSGALEDLNTLLQKRWKAGTYIPVTENDSQALLEIILAERRKELLFRTTRWSDLRRLNRESNFAVTLSRTINDTEYRLPAGDLRYAFPIPPQEIQNSGIEQNPR
ncbi:MAG TPA: RagB/SusD family nutrient uptake outer membrane protein [Chryseolinea sp.]|nr:RagB/SusD family nutrient uptake outer membrane protein [Chryseolinea sp.]